MGCFRCHCLPQLPYLEKGWKVGLQDEISILHKRATTVQARLGVVMHNWGRRTRVMTFGWKSDQEVIKEGAGYHGRGRSPSGL